MIKYSVAMTIRMVCIVLMLFSHGWWLAVFGVGAIVLPYFAVVIANTPLRTAHAVEGPGGIVRVTPEPTGKPTDHDSEPHDDGRKAS